MIDRALDNAFKDAEACDLPAPEGWVQVEILTSENASVLTDEQAENVRDALSAHDFTPGAAWRRLIQSMPDWAGPQLPRLLAYHDALKDARAARDLTRGELRLDAADLQLARDMLDDLPSEWRSGMIAWLDNFTGPESARLRQVLGERPR